MEDRQVLNHAIKALPKEEAQVKELETMTMAEVWKQHLDRIAEIKSIIAGHKAVIARSKLQK